MANDRLIFEVVAQGKNLKAVQLDANKLADGVERTGGAYDKTSKSQDRFHKGQKGVAQVSANSTKNFSKMRSAMGSGSSGVVGAYATLAANVFALTAAFGALQRAAQFEQLRQGLVDVGLAAGQNLTFVSDQLIAMTGNAISAEGAMRTVSLGMSSGFNSSQLEQLTKVAMGASRALGRDLADAQDRLIRGVAKLEPEILDELGIMVRLDDAAEDFASALGKTASQLTILERRQAFANATIDQGLKKFGALADSADPNPYNQLSASLDNLMKAGVGMLNGFLVPLVEFLANSQYALTGAVALFGSTIAGQLIPGLTDMASNAAAAAEASGSLAAEQAANSIAASSASGKMKEYGQALADGTATEAGYKSALNSSTRQINKRKKALAEMTDTSSEAYVKEAEDIAVLEGARDRLVESEGKSVESAGKRATANSLEYASQGKLVKGFKELVTGNKLYGAETRASAASTTFFGRAMTGARIQAYALGTSLKFVATGLLAIMPYIGLIIIGFELLKSAFKFLFPPDESQQKSKAVVESFGAIGESIILLKMDLLELDDPVEIITRKMTVFSNNLQQIVSGVKAVQSAQMEELAAKTKLATDEVSRLAVKVFEMESRKFTGGVVDDRTLARQRSALRGAQSDLKNLSEAAVEFDVSELAVPLAAGTAAVENFAREIQEIDSTPIDALKGTLANLQAQGEKINAEEFNKYMRALENALAPIQSYEQALNGAEASQSEFAKQQSKLFSKGTTKYDDIIDSLDVMAAQFKVIEKLTKDATGQLNLFGRLAEALKLKERFGIDDVAGLDHMMKTLTTARDRLVEIPGELKVLAATEKRVGLNAGFSLSQYEQQLEAQEKQKRLKIEQGEQEIAILQTVEGQAKAGVTNEQAQDRIKQIRQEMLKTQVTLRNEEEITHMISKREEEIKKKVLDIQQKALQAEKALNAATESRLRSEEQIANYSDTLRMDLNLNAQEEFDLFMKTTKSRTDQIRAEEEARKAKLENETKIADLTFKIVKARMVAVKEERRNLIAELKKDVQEKKDAANAFGSSALGSPQAIAANKAYNEAQTSLSAAQTSLSEISTEIAGLPDISGELETARLAQEMQIGAEATAQVTAEKAKELELRRKVTAELINEMGVMEEITRQHKLQKQAAVDPETAEGRAAALIIEKDRLETAKELNDILKGNLALDRQALDIANEQAAVTNQMDNLSTARRRRATDGDETAKQAADRLQDQVGARQAQITSEETLSITMVQNERKMAEIKYDMIDASYALIEAELAAAKVAAETREDAAAVASLDKAIAATQGSRESFNENKTDILQAIEDRETQAIANIKAQATLDRDKVKLEADKADRKASNTALAASGQGDTTVDRVLNLTDEGGLEAIDNVRDRFKAIHNTVGPMVESLRELGPEGEVIAAVVDGAFAMTDAWTGFAEVLKDGTPSEAAAAGFAAAAASIGAINSIMNAESNKRIAQIDKEIGAEKKRDGKSKESLARIKELEKKKERMERKRFEQNKKMMIAQAVMSTAAGAIGIFASLKSIYEIPVAIAGAAAIAAIGAAQIAMIASTSYDGGGSVSSSSMPSSVGVGQRNNKVDLARGGNAGGELAYLRGERGMGSSASDFRPSFGGRYRAAGGTAYMVGEQGPELVIPEQNSRVVAADDVEGVAEAGPSINANFTIQAIDATNMQETLTAQRGNIIGMIREAANASGETFLETVDTLGLTSQGAE